MSDKIYKDERKGMRNVEGRREVLKNWNIQQQKVFTEHERKKSKKYYFIKKNPLFGKQK
jgi:hypothetical protein